MSDRQEEPSLRCQNCGNVGFRVSNLQFGNGSDIAVRYCRSCGEPYNQSELEATTTGCLMCGNDYDDPDHIYGCPNSPHFDWGYEVSDSGEETEEGTGEGTTIRRMIEQRAEAEGKPVSDLIHGDREPAPVYGTPHLSDLHGKLFELSRVNDELEEMMDLPIPEFEPETSHYTDLLVSSMGARRRSHQVWLAMVEAYLSGEDVIIISPDGAKKIDHETLEIEDHDLYE